MYVQRRLYRLLFFYGSMAGSVSPLRALSGPVAELQNCKTAELQE